MSHEFLLGGSIVLDPIIPACLLALLLTALLSWGLVRIGAYRFLWRRPLVEGAIFCIILALISLFSPIPGTR